MTRNSAAVFGVKKGETVTIEVTPISVGAFVAAGHHKKPLVDQSPTKRHFLFTFRVTEPVASAEVVKLIVQFMGTEPSTARYEVVISGDKGGSFTLLPIAKPSSAGKAERSREWRFEVEK